MRRPLLGLGMLGTLVLGSALAVVYTKHESRVLFAELQALQGRSDELEIEWGQLQLEQSTLAAHQRVERDARERLGMVAPSAPEIRVIYP